MKTKFITAALGAAAFALLGQGFAADEAQAAISGIDWSTITPIVDPNDAGIESQDILNAWHTSDGTNHYFRIELENAPTNASNASLYGIYISLSPSSGNTANHDYVPYGITGIDVILDSHFNYNQDFSDGLYDGWYQHDLHTYDPNLGGGVYVPQPLANHAEYGSFLEWWAPVAEIGSDFEWMAASHDTGPGYDTYDTTGFVSVSQVPLPASVLIMLPGLGLIAGARRKNQRTA